MRISPTAAPSTPKAPRKGSPTRSPAFHTNLSLKTVIGTSASNSNGFSALAPNRQFAYCAGSTTVLAELDDELNVSQRFFRARSSVQGSSSSHSTTNTPLAGAHSRPRSYSAGSRPSPYKSEHANSSQASSARDRVKAVTSVALSPNGKFLAAGETGYSPRLLIFSTAPEAANDAPLSSLTEHSFGVKSLAFSSDSQYLASLGDINDGFLNVWAVNPKTGAAKLHSTNKCTSVVRGMCFLGNNFVTVGVRHIKAWRLESSSPTRTRFSETNSAPTPLTGRNCVLGNLGDSTFTCIASVSDTEAIICMESGGICLYDDRSGHQKLSFLTNAGFGIQSVAYDAESDKVWVGGRDQTIETYTLEELKSLATSKPPSPAPSQGSSRPSSSHGKPAITCVSVLSGALVTVDSTHSLRICSAANGQEHNCDGAVQVSHAERDAVLGISPLKKPYAEKANFFTWSAGGLINFWDFKGKRHASQVVPLEQAARSDEDSNELRVVRTIDDMDCFVAGDKFGVVSVFSGQSWKCLGAARAHAAEITDIAIHKDERMCLVASCGRDRVVQLFRKTDDGLELIQTLEEHVGSVGRILFMNDGEKLISCSSDRTVVIRERVTKESNGQIQVAYCSAKVITMKSSPVSMELLPCDPDGIVLSSTDRSVHCYHVTTGRCFNSFRASDCETSDAVVMSSLSIACETPGQNPTLLVGVCSTDKSLRVYDFDRGNLLSGEFGHTEGVTDVIFLEDRSDPNHVKKTLISTGLDGIIMIWDLSFSRHQSSRPPSPARGEDETTPRREAARQPLRRVISKTELVGFQRSDGLPPVPTTGARDASPSRTIRTKTSRTSMKSNTPGSTRGSPATLTTPSHQPPSRLSAVSHNRSSRSPSPSARRPTTATSRHRRPSINSSTFLRTSSNDSGSNRTNETARRTVRRPSTGVSTTAAAASPSSSVTDLSNVNTSTEQMARTLKTYRRKLRNADSLPQGAHDLENELKLTLKALEERAKTEKSKSSGSHLHFGKRFTSIGRKNKTHAVDDAKR